MQIKNMISNEELNEVIRLCNKDSALPQFGDTSLSLQWGDYITRISWDKHCRYWKVRRVVAGGRPINQIITVRAELSEAVGKAIQYKGGI